MRLVMGETGDYDDNHTWPVCAFTSSRRAATWARKANEWAAANGLAGRHWRDRESLPSNPWDPHMSVDYTGVKYYVLYYPVPLDPPLPGR